MTRERGRFRNGVHGESKNRRETHIYVEIANWIIKKAAAVAMAERTDPVENPLGRSMWSSCAETNGPARDGFVRPDHRANVRTDARYLSYAGGIREKTTTEKQIKYRQYVLR